MKINFITFGSHASYIDAGNRLIEQAKNTNIFDETTLYTGDNLKKENIFWENHQDFIEKNRRGYGYWLWKPYIIKKTMETMVDGDILLYLDCGCEIDCRNKDFFLPLIEIVKKDMIIGTDSGCSEKKYNKMDLIEKLDMNKDVYLNKTMRQAGAVLFLMCDKVREFVNEWYELGCDYHNIDDSSSIIKNFDCFKEHRHDQSIFSLLIKKNNLVSEHSLVKGKFIICDRNKTGLSKI